MKCLTLGYEWQTALVLANEHNLPEEEIEEVCKQLLAVQTAATNYYRLDDAEVRPPIPSFILFNTSKKILTVFFFLCVRAEGH
jgi:hypothetical protein